jgi:hypothetical protein
MQCICVSGDMWCGVGTNERPLFRMEFSVLVSLWLDRLTTISGVVFCLLMMRCFLRFCSCVPDVKRLIGRLFLRVVFSHFRFWIVLWLRHMIWFVVCLYLSVMLFGWVGFWVGVLSV